MISENALKTDPMETGDSSQIDHDRILPVTKALAFIIAPILFAAFIMLYLFPNHSGVLFAWPIKPKMSAMMLGATYLGGAYFFTRVIMAKRWHTVKIGFIPVSVFAAILGIATIAHWEKFTPGHISFILWSFLYFTLPFIIPVVWFINNRINQSISENGERKFPSWVYLSFGGLGLILIIAAMVLLIKPDWMIPYWPWTLTPLTARVMSAMFALSGLVGISVFLVRRMSYARNVFHAQEVSIILFLLAMVITRDEISWTAWYTWTFIAGLIVVFSLILYTQFWSTR